MTTTHYQRQLRDLELLDDQTQHCRCTNCFPGPWPLFKPFIAMCGRKAIYQSEGGPPHEIPPNACEDCVRLFGGRCPRCGAL